MLIEIRSNVFRSRAVFFHAGLNVILGDANATNSIGKSTMLMIVDFAFGGTSLLKHNRDLVPELGDHDYFFVFRFGEELYTFKRGTSDESVVYLCDEFSEPTRALSLEEYTALLKAAYQIQLPDLSFRALVSLYTRVWGKDNLAVLRPLHVVQNQSTQEAVDNLVKTFDEYEPIRVLSRDLASEEAKLRTLRKAASLDLIPEIGRKSYNANQNIIASLESELADIKANLAKYATNISEIVSKEVIDLKVEKDRLLNLRLPVESRLARVRQNLQERRSIRSQSFRDLASFFPQVNEERLGRIEDFHNGLARVLRAELRESEASLLNEVERINQEISRIDAQMATTLSSVEQPNLIVDRVYRLALDIGNAREQNELYEEENSLRSSVKGLRSSLSQQRQKATTNVEDAMNDGMRDLTTERLGVDRKCPHLTLKETTYTFAIPEDTGTGVAYTGLVVFDLTVFSRTALPILVHDTVVYKNIANDAVASLLGVYIGMTKQSFIALDEIDKYGSAAVELLRANAVLELSNETVLFIKDWRAKQKRREGDV